MMTTAGPAVKRSTEQDAAPVLPLAAALERRGLTAPALLYLAGHRPLAFAAGQLLALAAPLAAALGIDHTMEWAHLLSTPEGVDRLQAALETRRSGLQPDMAAERDEINRRAASPTYAGGRAVQESSSAHAACAAPPTARRLDELSAKKVMRRGARGVRTGRLLNDPNEGGTP